MGKTVTKTVTKLDRTGLDREAVVAVALDLVVSEGPAALTMRRLATELDVGTPTIYWHVGSRDELVAAIVQLQSERLADRPIAAGDARARVLAAARNMYAGALEQRAITSLAHQTGTSGLLLQDLQAALVGELGAAGLEGDAVDEALHSILLVVTGALVVTLSDSARLPGDRGEKVRSRAELEALATTTLRVVVDHHVPSEERP
jgi:TetR/AcrR family tetracycline transcriptional repressor